MSVLIFLLLVLLFCVLFIWTKILLPKKHLRSQHQELNAHHQRPLTDAELTLCRTYLAQRQRSPISFTERLLSKLNLARNTCTLRDKSVYTLNHSITHYSLSTSVPELNRYYLDAIEIHLPPNGQPFITADNTIELVYTNQSPLVITLNGHHLLDDLNSSSTQIPPSTTTDTSIRKETSERVAILNVRRQTVEEYALTHANNISEALILCCALLLIFCSLLTPLKFMPWILLASFLIILPCLWLMYRRPPRGHLQEIRTMRGRLRPWGLFGEANPKQQNLSLGILDLHYPEHWYPYIQKDIGQETIIEVDEQNRVVQHGPLLSLTHEVKKFPLQNWRHNLTLAVGSLLILIMTTSWLPTGISFKIALARLQGEQRVTVTDIDQLTQHTLHVGDVIDIKGSGRCIVPQTYQSNRTYDFLPFDCSAIYWNTHLSNTLPPSPIIEKTQALLATTSRQLDPDNNDLKGLNPQLASAIQKSGMILLNNFSDIVLKTAQLCATSQDCPRLKSALVNLENAKDWPMLVEQAKSGKLDGLNVLLRPNSAQNLTNLVNVATTTFMSKETRKMVETLSHLPRNGYLFINGQGQLLVDQEQPETSLFDLEPATQWKELQRISAQLLNTPFSLSGIITSLQRDDQGTLHVVVHQQPNTHALWRYVVTTLFLVCLIVLIVANTLLGIHRLRSNFSRYPRIKQDYEASLSEASPLLLRPKE
ncbi:intracellular growth attenuator family protein [Rosenbergiella australiborealis]|uniref:Intracellular growth attenuator family protein n=2 Tax=Rosenbergiella TaxID=1356488 RepID=A0ABS5T4M8_9GAMM|nr:IgaA/UmoB family intracellular growth attenuator [Rosenbergiella australiborealis]MBT0727328.1 intracellular growth attenuator family protein [Rosenbergiella australiborealis]